MIKFSAIQSDPDTSTEPTSDHDFWAKWPVFPQSPAIMTFMLWQRNARSVIRLIGAVLVVLSLSGPAISKSACVAALCDSSCEMHAARKPASCCPEATVAKEASCKECKCIKAPVETSADIDAVAAWSFNLVVCFPERLPVPEPEWIDLTSTRRIIAFSDGSPPSVPKGPHSGRAPPCSLGLPLACRA